MKRLALLSIFLALPVVASAQGYANIDPTDPPGTQAANTTDDEFRQLRGDILGGVAIEHDDGQTTASHQGFHVLPVGASPPAVASRPTGHLFLDNDDADSLIAKRSDGAAYQTVGSGFLTVVDASVAVGSLAVSTVNLGAYTSAHKEYIVSAYTSSANTPTIVLGVDDGGADIYVYVQLDEAGNDELVISNQTANAETVFYRVRKVVD